MKKNILLLLVLSLQASVFMAADRAFDGPSRAHKPSEVSFTSDVDQLSAPLDEDQLAELMADLHGYESESDEREESPVIGGVSFSRSVTQRDLGISPAAQAVVTPTAKTVAERSQQFRGVRSLGTIPGLTPLSVGADSPRETPSPSRPISRHTGAPEFDFAKPRGIALLGIPASQLPGSSFSSTRVVSTQLSRPKSSLARMVAESQAVSASRVQPTTPIGSARKDICRMM
jgi:hypothetical protein